MPNSPHIFTSFLKAKIGNLINCWKLTDFKVQIWKEGRGPFIFHPYYNDPFLNDVQHKCSCPSAAAHLYSIAFDSVMMNVNPSFTKKVALFYGVQYKSLKQVISQAKICSLGAQDSGWSSWLYKIIDNRQATSHLSLSILTRKWNTLKNKRI